MSWIPSCCIDTIINSAMLCSSIYVYLSVHVCHREDVVDEEYLLSSAVALPAYHLLHATLLKWHLVTVRMHVLPLDKV
jgi:hypothetical protein